MKKIINSNSVAHLLRAAFSLTLILIAVQLVLPLAHGQRQTATQQSLARPDAPQGGAGCSWAAGPNMPTVHVRAVGVYFPANNRLYAMGGRTSDSAGSDVQNPREYNIATNSWSIRTETTPDNQMNNMACGVLTDAGTPWIYCVGGSAAGQTVATARVFRFNPVTGAMQNLGANWPGDDDGITLPGGFAVQNNKLYLFGGFQINTSMKNGIWEFTPGTNTWVTKTATLPVPLGYIPTATVGSLIYMAGGSIWDGTTLQDSNSSVSYNPATNTIAAIATIPRSTGETRGLAYSGGVRVLGGGRVAPNPSNEVDIYAPGTNSWSTGTPFATPRRNFPTDTDGSKIYLAGGYASDGVTPMDTMEIFSCNAPTVTSAVSRKMHTGVGNFDVNLPLTGSPGIEDRTGGATNDYTMVVTFSANVTVTGNPQAQVTSGTGCVGSGGVCMSGNNVVVSGAVVTIPLTNVTNNQIINVRLNGVNGAADEPAVDITIPMQIVIGDVNANGSVSSADIALTKSRIGQAVTTTNFRSDVNASGGINASDITIIKQHL